MARMTLAEFYALPANCRHIACDANQTHIVMVDGQLEAVEIIPVASPVDLAWVNEYDMTQKLSNSIRCF